MIISKSLRFFMSISCIVGCIIYSESCLGANLWIPSNSKDTYSTAIPYISNGLRDVEVFSTGIIIYLDSDCKIMRSEFNWNKTTFLMQPGKFYQLNPKELYLNNVGKNCSAIGNVCYMKIEITTTNDQQRTWPCVPITCNSATKSCERLNNGGPYIIKLPTA